MYVREFINPVKTPKKVKNVMKDITADIAAKNHYVKPEVAKIDLFNNPMFNTRVFLDQLYNCDNIKDEDVYELIMNNHHTLLTEKFISDYNCANLFTNIKFVSILSQALYKINITYDIMICINKIVYDYINLPEEATNNLVKDTLLNMSKIVNRVQIGSLTALNIPEDIACKIVLFRHSSVKELVNIKRMNWAICTSDKEIMTEQMIVNIYERLVDKLTDLVEGVMFDIYPPNLPDEVLEIQSITSLAILSILDQMPSDTIATVLKTYTGDRYSILGTMPIRFSFTSISNDFSRVLQVVNYLANVEQIYVP